jgi:hypothetical protein
MVAFRADLDVMDELSSRMGSIASTLDAEGHSAPDSSALGAGDAAGALDHFVSNWSHGRSEIVSGLHDARTALGGASGNYRASDQGIAAKL